MGTSLLSCIQHYSHLEILKIMPKWHHHSNVYFTFHPLAQVYHASAGSGWCRKGRPGEHTWAPHAPGRGGLWWAAAGDSHHDQVCGAVQHQAPLLAHLRWRSATCQLHGSCEFGRSLEGLLLMSCCHTLYFNSYACSFIWNLCFSWSHGRVLFTPSSTIQSTPSASPVRMQLSGRNFSNPAPPRGYSYLWVSHLERMLSRFLKPKLNPS